MKRKLVVEAKGLSKRFGDVVAVESMALDVAEGEIFGLIGPDGAGKTTLLRLLATVIPPTAGEAWVLGKDIRREAEAVRAKIGYMAQRFSLYGDLTVWENLNFFADVHGVGGDERGRRLERLLAFARLEEFRHRRSQQLSGGMQKKLALACALVHQPRLLILDEPTTGVDPISRREFWDILTDLHVEAVTILVSTPYMDEAERCSSVGFMYGGSLMVRDTPEHIVGMVPNTLLVAHLLPTASGRLPIREAQNVVKVLPGILEAQVYGDKLHLFVKDAGMALPVIRGALQQAGVPVSSLMPARPHLEQAFIYLLGKRDGEVHE